MALPLDELVETPALVNQRAQDLAWDDLLFDYELALDDMQALLGGLSDVQVHFKPSDQDYSIAEVITHAAHGDQFLFAWLQQLASGHAPDESNWRDMTRGATNIAALDDVRASIETSRGLARAVIAEVPDPCNLQLTAKHPYFGSLNAKGWLYFMCTHRGVHLRQCEEVIGSAGFPRSSSLQSLPREEYLQPSDRKTWLKQEEVGKKRRAGHTGQEAKGEKRETRGKERKTTRAK